MMTDVAVIIKKLYLMHSLSKFRAASHSPWPLQMRGFSFTFPSLIILHFSQKKPTKWIKMDRGNLTMCWVPLPAFSNQLSGIDLKLFREQIRKSSIDHYFIFHLILVSVSFHSYLISHSSPRPVSPHKHTHARAYACITPGYLARHRSHVGVD